MKLHHNWERERENLSWQRANAEERDKSETWMLRDPLQRVFFIWSHCPQGFHSHRSFWWRNNEKNKPLTFFPELQV
jgi:hypothetical protein